MSIRRFDQVQNRKVVAQYLKQAPRPTLGQLLQGSFEETEEEVEAPSKAEAKKAKKQENAEGVKPEVK